MWLQRLAGAASCRAEVGTVGFPSARREYAFSRTIATVQQDHHGHMAELLRQIAGLLGCRVLPAVGPVTVTGDVVVPEDVRQLDALCGGVVNGHLFLALALM